jgi:hypothetical protein
MGEPAQRCTHNGASVGRFERFCSVESGLGGVFPTRCDLRSSSERAPISATELARDGPTRPPEVAYGRHETCFSAVLDFV